MKQNFILLLLVILTLTGCRNNIEKDVKEDKLALHLNKAIEKN